MSEHVVITGVAGQDGSLIANLLVNKGFEVIGLYRPSSNNAFWRLDEMGITNRIKFFPLDISSYHNLGSVIPKKNIVAFLHFAGSTLTVSSHNNPSEVFHTNTYGVLEILNYIRNFNRECFVFLSSSSEVYGNFGTNISTNSNGICNPINPYGVSHSSILNISEMFREVHELVICNGVYFNHESIFRDQRFLARKLSLGVTQLLSNPEFVLEIGSFNSVKDWGCAQEFMSLTFELFKSRTNRALDIGTGKLTYLKDVLSLALECVGFVPEFNGMEEGASIIDRRTGRTLVKSVSALTRFNESKPRLANVELLLQTIQKTPSKTLIDIIPELVKHEISRKGFS